MLLDGPHGLYPFDETSGTQAKDVSGNARHATYTAGPTLGQAGPAGLTAMRMTAAAQSAAAPTNLAAADTSDFTVSMFCQLLGVTFNANANTLFDQYYANFNNRCLWYTGSAASGAVGTGIQIGGSSVDAAGTPIKVGQWHHVACRRTSGAINLFVDGVVVATGTLNVTVDGKNTWFGGANEQGTLTGFNGRLAWAGVYRSALATDRIRSHYQAGFRSGVSVG